MKPVFCDTVYFLALLNPTDRLRSAAVAYSQTSGQPLLTTEWILMEVGDALCRERGRARFARLLEILAHSPNAEVIPADHSGFRRACDLFMSRPDKEWSLTDCHSFVVMKDREVEEALTHDHHFEQAGFRILL